MLSQVRREAAYWRDLLKRIARDMEQSAKTEPDLERQRWFVSRARRIRERLTRGMPEDWREPA